MSITWYKLKIKKHINEYECYIRFKFDSQIQSIKIKSFIYLIDAEGNIKKKKKKNKNGYDPRILGSLTVEKNFLKNKRKKNLYYDVMKYQGNFNICNLPMIDDYFRNGKALVYQYRDMIYLMDNKKYKIQMGPKKFTLILDVINYGYIKLNLYSKLEEVERQELIFLQQNEDALCHRYISNKSESNKNKKDSEEIEIIDDDENENLNQVLPNRANQTKNNNINLEEEKDTREGEDNNDEENLNNTLNTYEVNSDESSVYDSIFFKDENNNNNNNDKSNINNNNKLALTGKDKEITNDKINNNNYNIVLNNNSHTNYKNGRQKSKSNRLFSNSNTNTNGTLSENNTNNNNNGNSNFNTNYNISINSTFNNNNYNNNSHLFEKLKKEGNNIISSKILQNNQNQSFTEYSTKKESLRSRSKKYNNILSNNIKINENFIGNIFKKAPTSFSSPESLISNLSEKNMLLYSSGFDTNKYYLKLLYKSTKDTDDITVFQNKVHNKKNIFIIILTLDNKKFGFYSFVGISLDNKEIKDNKAYLFKLYKEQIDCFRVKNDEIAIYANKDYVLNLGGEQLVIRDKFLSNASCCGLKMKNYRLYNNYQLNNGNKNFIIKEMEVYCISEI